jgi:hypothetical protein
MHSDEQESDIGTYNLKVQQKNPDSQMNCIIEFHFYSPNFVSMLQIIMFQVGITSVPS